MSEFDVFRLDCEVCSGSLTVCDSPVSHSFFEILSFLNPMVASSPQISGMISLAVILKNS